MRWTLFFFIWTISIYATTIHDFFAIDPKLEGAILGIYIEDAKTGEEAFSHHGDTHFQLASLTKLATAYAAIHKLGSGFRYETQLQYTGIVDKNGILNGDVIVQGGGDPTLSLDVIPEWGFALKKKGIHSIQGKILADASCFETLSTSPHWEFMDLGNYYAAGASGLSVNQNSYSVTFRPGGAVGEKAEIVRTDPIIPSLTISNEMRTGAEGTGDRGHIYGAEYSPLQIYRGTIPAGSETFTLRGAIPDPARFFAETFARHLQMHVPVKVVRKKGGIEGEKYTIASKYSPPLNQIVREMLQKSNNLYAEHLLKTIGDGESEKGLAYIHSILEKVGVGLFLKDGCGAARTNWASPQNMTRLIRVMRQDPLMQEAIDSLPELGVSGTLADRKHIADVQIFGKTGSMTGVSNLAGFFLLQDGRSYNFCICINNFTCEPSVAKNAIHSFLQTFIQEIL